MLDYKLMEALFAVANEGGFERAARVLNLTQSAVSQRVKLLEELTGRVLLERSSPPRLTADGRKMVKHCLQVRLLENDLAESLEKGEWGGFSSVAIGMNGDSLATWFLDAVRDFLSEKRMIMEIFVDDQEETHLLLKKGKVAGCISTRKQPVQGCRNVYLGCMKYRMLATPGFAARWFPRGFVMDAVRRAPALVFNRKDEMHRKFLLRVFGRAPAVFPAHYVPSSEKFVDFIVSSLAYGMLPDLQGAPLLESGKLVNLAPDVHVPVNLYWHCWNLRSGLLDALTWHLTRGAEKLLSPGGPL